MKASTMLLIGGGVLLFLNWSSLGVAAATANFVFQGISFNSLTSWTINIMAQNVSNATVQVNSMAGTVFLNGNQLGNISDFTVRTIPANSQVVVPVVFQISLLSLPGDVAAQLSSGGTSFDFKVQANANVNGLVVPFTIDQNITI